VDAPLGYILSSLFFIPYRNSLDTIAPLVVPGWTLSFEMFFYLLFAGALALRIGVARALTPVMILLAVIGLFYKENWPTISVLASPLLLEFLAGLLLGQAMIKGIRSNTIALSIVGILAVPFLLSGPTTGASGMRILEWGLPAYLVVQAAAMVEDRFGGIWPRWILLIGDASYSLYLSHLLVIGFLVKIFIRSHIWTMGVVRRQDEIVTALFCLIVSVLVSIPLYSSLRSRLPTCCDAGCWQKANRHDGPLLQSAVARPGAYARENSRRRLRPLSVDSHRGKQNNSQEPASIQFERDHSLAAARFL
jgi:peptidoglycan/LPS O-acetylase OafA/YrhL